MSICFVILEYPPPTKSPKNSKLPINLISICYYDKILFKNKMAIEHTKREAHPIA